MSKKVHFSLCTRFFNHHYPQISEPFHCSLKETLQLPLFPPSLASTTPFLTFCLPILAYAVNRSTM